MSCSNDALYVGMGAGNGLKFEVRLQEGDTWDPEAIEEVEIRALPPSQVAKTFTLTTIVDQSAEGFDVEYPLDEDDFDEAGEWRFYLKLINGDGDVVRTVTQARVVKVEFGL